MRRHRQPRTAFVFAGGGSLGAVEVGMLRALTDAGIEADFVVGSSVGAINAAYFAGDPTPHGVRRLERIWRSVSRADLFPARPVRGVLALLGSRDSMVSPTALRTLLEQHLAYRRLERAVIPCHVVATDLLTGEEVVLSSGPTVKALLASTAIPGVFPPVHLRGRHLVDGGVASNTPVASAVRLGAERIVVLPTGFSCPLERRPLDAVGVALQALNLLIARQLALDVERLRLEAELRVVPPLCPLARSPHDFSGTAELIERAARVTRDWLDGGGLEQAGVPGSLRPDVDQTGNAAVRAYDGPRRGLEPDRLEEATTGRARLAGP